MNNSFTTPKKTKARKEEKDALLSTPRSLHIDWEETKHQVQPSPVPSLPPNTMVDSEEELLEQFWRESGVEAASAIAARLASSAVMLAAKFTLKQMTLERQASQMAQLGLGRVGWPKRKSADPLLGHREVPATWRFGSGPSRNAVALATPPRPYLKRKFQQEEDPDMVDMLGITPISPVVEQLRSSSMQGELAALHKLDAKDRVQRAMERLRRKEKVRDPRIIKKVRIQKEEELPSLEDYQDEEEDDHAGHGCSFDKKHQQEDTTDDEDDFPSPVPAIANQAVNTGAVNVNIMCSH